MAVNAACWVYELEAAGDGMRLLVKFRTDFAAEESSQVRRSAFEDTIDHCVGLTCSTSARQSCAWFVGDSTILTGGEDGVVRVWRLNRDPTSEQKKSGTSAALDCSEASGSTEPPTAPHVGDKVVDAESHTLVTLEREYRGHTKRIRAVHVDPSHRNLVVSSCEDQTCHIWRLTENAALFRFSKDDALDTALQMLRMKPLTGPRKHQFRCARFANSGRNLYTVLTPARGDSILVKWKPETLAQTHDDEWRWVVEAAAVAGDKPVASLCVSDDDDFVCTAAVSGDVRVFRTSTLQPYQKVSSEQHTFAITGMSFALSEDKNSKVFHLVSGGADKNLLRHDIPFTGGEVVPGSQKVAAGVKGLVSGVVRLALNAFMAATLLFILLLFIHAKEALLRESPFDGFEVRVVAVVVVLEWTRGVVTKLMTILLWDAICRTW